MAPDSMFLTEGPLGMETGGGTTEKAAAQPSPHDATVETEWAVISSALERRQGRPWTAQTIAARLNIPYASVKQVLKTHRDDVRVSYVRDAKGRRLYAAKNFPMRPREKLATIRAFIIGEP